jgi:hypothetical protein
MFTKDFVMFEVVAVVQLKSCFKFANITCSTGMVSLSLNIIFLFNDTISQFLL